jgi:hypothetical protein
MEVLLSPVEARVLACLIEKAATTPEYYPLTMNALVAACNQKSNRDPVMALDAAAVTAAIEELRYRDHLVWEVTLPGTRTSKYRHDIAARLPMDTVEQALLCELMLRGPQTIGELRTRIERLCGPQSPEVVTAALDGLMQRDGAALAMKLPPGPGRREARYAQLLSGAPESDCVPSPAATVEKLASPLQQRMADLEQRVAALEQVTRELGGRFDAFRTQFE